MDNTVQKHIDVLDGIRAVAIVLVVWYHFWQQTWLTPYIVFDNKITKYFGISNINLATFVRYGAEFVDMLILLSAVCNFYPYARSILLGEPWPDTKVFYKKRAIRIIPSYYLCVFIMLIFALAEKRYSGMAAMWQDLIARLTFCSIFSERTYLGSQLNGVLWTVQVEVIYYILMPWIAKCFKKRPGITCIVMWLCGILSSNFILYQKADRIRFYVNHFLTFAGCYANGMLICMIYITVKKQKAENRYTEILAVLMTVVSVIAIDRLFAEHSNSDQVQIVQLEHRFLLSLAFSAFILAVMFGTKWLKAMFANRIMRFISTISYNLYIWHQVIAVKCKEYKIPYWEGEKPPNMTGDRVWQWKYQIMIILFSLSVAMIVTYLFERPVSNFLKRCERKKVLERK